MTELNKSQINSRADLNEGIFDIPNDISLSKLFPDGFELVIKYKDGKTTRAGFKSYREVRKAAEKTTASDILKAFIIVKKAGSEKLSQLLNKPDSLILANVEKGKIDTSKISKVLRVSKEAAEQQKADNKATKKLDKALSGKVIEEPLKADETPKTDKQELEIDSAEAAKTETSKEESKAQATTNEPKTETPKAEEQKPAVEEPKPEEPKPAVEIKSEEPAPETKKPNRYRFTQADSAKSAVSRKVKIALSKIGVDVNSEEGQKKVQQVKDTLFSRQATARPTEKEKVAVGESYIKEGKNNMKKEKIKTEDFEENPFEYEDWDIDFEPRMDFAIDEPEFNGGFDDDIEKTEVVVKAEVPAEEVKNIPEDGQAKVELPVEDKAENEEEPKEESAIDVIKDKFDAKKVDNQLIISKKGEMENVDSDKISVNLADDEFEALKKDFEGNIEGYDIDKMVEALNEADEDEVECQLCHEMLNKAEAEKVENIGYVCKECKESISNIDESLKEDTHAKYAKPEGDRVSSYNNALKYAKQENKPYIYGYTNYTGKFFALDQPIKCVDPTTKEDTQKFKDQYKNCVTVYMVYPDKEPVLM